jgi:rhodanese-related sulfurtransferase
MSLPLEISPAEVKALVDAGQPLHLIDVREPAEHALTQIPGATLIPMNTVPAQLQHLEALSDQAPLIVFCHHGMRSLNTAHWLRQQGIANVQSMAGGIDLWSLQIDPAVPRY